MDKDELHITNLINWYLRSGKGGKEGCFPTTTK